LGTEKNIGTKGVLQVKKHRKKKLSVEELTQGVFDGDKAILARAITIVESTRNEDLKKAYILIENCLLKEIKSIRIGITGVPGVGKSSFIEVLGTTLTGLGKKVAVLAVDPTSTRSKGSILGDKTRMQELVKDPNAFIRPSPSGESLGGVARKTRESVILCEAAGFDIVLIETVGVGQSETAVHSMVDFFLLLKLAGAGDELQGIKRGIMEMADAIAINKADGDNLKRAQRAKVEFERALQLYPPKENGWIPNGSDFPVERINPLFGFYASVARKDQSGYPEGGFQMENAISREEALRAMTIWAARAGFEEDLKGSIEAGKLADFVVTSKDLMSAPEAELFSIKVDATWSGGEKVYSRQ